MKRALFKLRSGNKIPFKAMGEEKETVEQYNARIKAEHEARLKSHSDSTSSYNAQLEKNALITQANDSYGESNIRRKNQKKVLMLTKKQKDLGISIEDEPEYTSDEAYNWYSNDPSTEYKTTSAESLNPGDEPVEPELLPTRVIAKNVELPKKTTTPELFIPKKKYITQGKFKINLQTGEKTKIKKTKVKKNKRPGSRSVKNLVTGKNNKVQ